jgi:hypothetical protein
LEGKVTGTLGSWNVQVAFPEAKLNKFAEWLFGAGIAHAGGPHGLGGAMASGLKWLYSGTPIAGKLTLESDTLRFEPNKFAAALYYEVAPSLNIPISEVRSAKAAASFLGVSANPFLLPRLMVETSRGNLTIISQFSSKDIAREINCLLAS